MMITHYDMSTGEMIGTETHDGPAVAAMSMPERPTPRLATVQEEAGRRPRQPRHHPAVQLHAIDTLRRWHD